MNLVEEWAGEELAALSKRGLRRSLETLESRPGAHVVVGGRTFVNFTSNDYLGLCGDERLVTAAKNALDDFGSGSGASRLLVGGSGAHVALEEALADWLGTPAALLFNSGYAANVGLLQALADRRDAIFSDALNHASIIDGCRLSRAEVQVFAHGDVAALEERLAASKARRRIVVTESVFSMDGDLAPLQALREVCDRHGAALIVDEAHAIGVFGEGLCARENVKADLRVGTLGKALGSSGAFVAGPAAVMELLWNRARSLVFSTALPPSSCGAALEAVRIARTEQSRVERLWNNVRRLGEALGIEATSPIVPVVLGEAQRAMDASETLRQAGLLVKAIRPPTVPEGTSRLRIVVTAGHSDEDIDRLAAALAPLARETHGR